MELKSKFMQMPVFVESELARSHILCKNTIRKIACKASRNRQEVSCLFLVQPEICTVQITDYRVSTFESMAVTRKWYAKSAHGSSIILPESKLDDGNSQFFNVESKALDKLKTSLECDRIWFPEDTILDFDKVIWIEQKSNATCSTKRCPEWDTSAAPITELLAILALVW